MITLFIGLTIGSFITQIATSMIADHGASKDEKIKEIIRVQFVVMLILGTVMLIVIAASYLT